AHVPQELLAAAAEANEEEAHFKEVFDQFVALKQECGEPTAGLTLDKFKQTLRKNRDAILAKHGAKSVRFTVYKKDGKAALKATPVKD
ncbi:MAG: cell division protein FtsK, partial [Myxococcales bacterium]|nr:cell division protein FtsK [Myxococcales bacterium]